MNAAAYARPDARDLDDPVGRRVVEDLARFESAVGLRRAMLGGVAHPQGGVASGADLRSTHHQDHGLSAHASDLWIYEEIREAFLSGVGRDLPAAEFVAIHGPAAVPGAHVQIEAMAAEG